MLFQFASSFNFRDLFAFLRDFGVYDYILPFLLVVAIVFAVLEKTQIFGENKTNISAIIAIVVGLLLVAQQGIVETINLFLPRVSLILIVILMGLVVLSMLGGGSFKGLQGGLLFLFAAGAVIALILALTPNFGYDLSWITPYDRSMLFLVGIIVLLLAFLWWMFTGKKSNDEGGLSKFLKSMDKSLRGGKE